MWRLLAVFLLLLIGLLPVALAQQPNPPAGGDDFVQEELPATEPNAVSKRQLYQMVLGNEEAPDPSADASKKIIAENLKWYFNRLTWEKVQVARDSSVGAIMEDILGQGSTTSPTKVFPPLIGRQQGNDPDQVKKYQRQREYVKAMVVEALPQLRLLLKNKQLIVRVNAARILERFAEWGQVSVVDTLVGIINNPKEHDAVRFWAIDALGHLLKEFAADGKFGEKDPNGAKYQQAALAVYNWLAAHAAMPVEKVSQMTPEEKDAISYIRRHAMTALGNTHRPRIVDPSTGGSAQGPTAELLVKILDNKEIAPPARLNERVEAAVQLTRLSPKYSPAYQPDFVVYRLASFVSTLGSEAAADTSRNKERWKYFAVALSDAAAEMEKQAPANSPAGQYIAKLKSRNFGVLEFLYDASKSSQAPTDLFNWLGANPPASKSVFKD